MSTQNQQHLPALEGIRGYAFLLVFFCHFGWLSHDVRTNDAASTLFKFLDQLCFVAVPVFFALSGYLITGVLLKTREREGFFRVFYARRVLRVFPLYYLTLIGVVVALLCLGVRLRPGHLSFLVYLHNWVPGGWVYFPHPMLRVTHFWSLAVEEQFYLVWPLVIWLLRSRRALLGFCYGCVALSVLAHFAAAVTGVLGFAVYQGTLYRADTIMLGSALAIHARSPNFRMERLVRPAMLVVAAGCVLLFVRALTVRTVMSLDSFDICIVLPVISLMGAALLVLTLHPDTLVFRLCKHRWAVHLGQRTYSLYVLHYLFLAIYEAKMALLKPWLGGVSTHLIAPALAFIPIYALAEITYRCIELPSLHAKKHFNYGPVRNPAAGEARGALGAEPQRA